MWRKLVGRVRSYCILVTGMRVCVLYKPDAFTCAIIEWDRKWRWQWVGRNLRFDKNHGN